MADALVPSVPALQPRLRARLIVQHFISTELGVDLDADKDIYVVWFCKTLQNWKALLSTTIEDTRYYEVTYDGDKDQAYMDSYLKEANRIYEDSVELG